MYSRTATQRYTDVCSDDISRLKQALDQADAVLVGAGAGLSTSAGLTYDGERFERLFGDFSVTYGIKDMYSGGFYRFPTQEEYWAWWSRHILYNRYIPGSLPVYGLLLDLMRGRDYFVLTSNVDHQFQLAGFEKKRLFYMQGDYGLWQCSAPCCERTYDNEATVRRMATAQKNMRVPSALIPYCPVCGRPMTMNLHCDDTFVQDDGWHEAHTRYRDFLSGHKNCRLLCLELGVGYNTPGIIKYPFWETVRKNGLATYAVMNLSTPMLPSDIRDRSVWLRGDIGESLRKLGRMFSGEKRARA